MRSQTCALSLSLLLPLLAGCRQNAMHLRVSHGFRGQVVVSCDSNGETGATVPVDDQGRGQASVCPRDGGDVYVDRDRTATLVRNVEWLRTGDGLVTQLRLAVP